MQVLSLTLKGFRGIRSGLNREQLSLDFERLADGAQLVAIAGANGRGKSTVMDNMHPFLTMPSRAAVAGPGGFSYYDHVFLPESEKDLTWAHEGRSYRSQVVIRTGARRRTEAFLHALDDAGRWQPMVLDDGTVSDGKVETYTRCVERVCGSAETFFTSVFSAQGKRPLNSYRNAEIKSLLADLLGQDEVLALGQKAGETGRLLKAGLGLIRQELEGLSLETQRLHSQRGRLDGAHARVAQNQSMRQEAQRGLETAQERHAQTVAERERAQDTEMRRTQLLAERQAVVDANLEADGAMQAQDERERIRLGRLEQRLAARVQQQRARRQTLEQARQRCLDVLADADAVWRAAKRLPLAERVLSQRILRSEECRRQTHNLTQSQGAQKLAEQKLAGIEREAGQAALQAEALARRFGLTREVPCAGSDLQGQCRLLGDAHEAQALVPSARGRIAQLAQERVLAQGEIDELQGQSQALVGAPLALRWAERVELRARKRMSRMSSLSAQAPGCRQAETTLAEVNQELASVGPGTDEATPDEVAERQQIGEARRGLAQQRQRRGQQTAATLSRLDDALAALPPAFDAQRLAMSERAIAQARVQLTAAEQSHQSAVHDAMEFDALSRQLAAQKERQIGLEARRDRAQAELGHWNLFARCMSHDGLIALAIDDAGPALSALANDLLLACYGPRFAVSIHTLLETGKGEQREGFDIVVHDGESGESKSVGLMSGGERVWINECLTRAVALYLAQNSGRHYATLFSDEADGPLDPERKRMFLAMKREVLRLGGYEREFFVSQTPELTAMADVVIDLDALAAPECGSGSEEIARQFEYL